jgi:HD-GYP domain-containing protein (c-di-GMP phosphodiesterase class II)
MIHDLGKISVPAEILSRPGRLTDIEFSLVKSHSEVGGDILRQVEFPWPVMDMILQHHERLDGRVAEGATRCAILLEARILAVADVVEAMATHRPYRPALGIEKALDEIRQGAGRLYDSAVCGACLRLFEVEGYRLSPSLGS